MTSEILASGSPSLPLPHVVVAADWSSNSRKRWAARADLDAAHRYRVRPPEPVGELSTWLARVRGQAGQDSRILVGLDCPIGLPGGYASRLGVTSFREALKAFGKDRWRDFFVISDNPTLHQPFFPPPTQVKGSYPSQLARALGVNSLDGLRRRCEQKTQTRRAAQCLFFTLGGAQVGRAAIAAWQHVLQPALDEIRLWPFDGELADLLDAPGLTIVEIYPAEAYGHLGINLGTRGSKTRRQDRTLALAHFLDDFDSGPVHLSDETNVAMRRGFDSDDEFDAMAGLLSMLRVLTGQRSWQEPQLPETRAVEGWIFGQNPNDRQ